MKVIKYALCRQWGFIVIALLSILISFLTELPSWSLAIISALIIIVNETIEIRRLQYQKILQIALKLTQLNQEYAERFVNTSSPYSIFYLIRKNSGYSSEKQEVFTEWANGCNLSRDFLDGWLNSFTERLKLLIEKKVKQGEILSERCNEFQRINHYYYRLVEVFYQKANTGSIPIHLEKCYNDFVIEYNAFVQNLRNTMDEAKVNLNLNFDSKNINFAKEIHLARAC